MTCVLSLRQEENDSESYRSEVNENVQGHKGKCLEARVCLKHISLTSQYFLESTLPVPESHTPV